MPSVHPSNQHDDFACGVRVRLCAHICIERQPTHTLRHRRLFLLAASSIAVACATWNCVCNPTAARPRTDTDALAMEKCSHTINERLWYDIWCAQRTMKWQRLSDPLPIFAIAIELMAAVLLFPFTDFVCTSTSNGYRFVCECVCVWMWLRFRTWRIHEPKHQWIKSDLLLTESRRKYVWKP